MFKRDDETDRENYRPVSLLSVPSKILESVVNARLVRHVHRDKQWAYRQGYSTKLLLKHLTEFWRNTVDSGLALAVAFIDFKKAFNMYSVSHDILVLKLKRDYGISGPPLDGIKSYLKGQTAIYNCQ